MIRKNGFTLWMLTVSFLVNAQSNYKEGNVVTNTGVTINGFINYREWHKNPDRIQFKHSLDEEHAKTYTADSIGGFTISGYESYSRHVVRVSMDETNFENLKDYIDTSSVTKAVFLKNVASGDRVDLYSYGDEIKVRFYILDKRQEVPYELVYRKLLSNGQEITQSLFKQQLTKLAQDYGTFSPDLEYSITRTDYSAKNIKSIISNINSRNEPSTAIASGKKRKVDFFGGAGLAMSTMKYSGETLLLVDGLDPQGRFKYKDEVVTHSYLPRFSAGADIYFNPDIRRLIIRAELSASGIKSTVVSYYQFNTFSPVEENTYKFATWQIGFSPQVLYNLYNSNNLKWYLGAGFVLNYLTNHENTLERRDSQTGELLSVDNEYRDLKDIEMTAVVRSGMRIHERFDVSVLWSSPTKRIEYKVNQQTIKTSLLSLCVLYNLTK